MMNSMGNIVEHLKEHGYSVKVERDVKINVAVKKPASGPPRSGVDGDGGDQPSPSGGALLEAQLLARAKNAAPVSLMRGVQQAVCRETVATLKRPAAAPLDDATPNKNIQNRKTQKKPAAMQEPSALVSSASEFQGYVRHEDEPEGADVVLKEAIVLNPTDAELDAKATQ